MSQATIEHVNITVSDPDATADWLCDVFGWHRRWEGDAINGGRSIHVGTDHDYLAIYNPGKTTAQASSSYEVRGGLNHVGIVVDDLEEVEKRVIAAGFKPHSHANYEPGRRFYFHDADGIEFEVVSYT